MKAVPTFERTAQSLERTGETVVTTVVSASRRLDIVMLRWQARLDAPVWDRSLPWLSAVGFAVVLSLLALARYRDLGMGYELGHYVQAAYLMDMGASPVSSDLGYNVFADQGAWVFWPLVWAMRVLPNVPTLLLVQSVALALGVVPIWRMARGPANLRIGGATAPCARRAARPSPEDLLGTRPARESLQGNRDRELPTLLPGVVDTTVHRMESQEAVGGRREDLLQRGPV